MSEGASNGPDRRDNLVLMKLPLLFQVSLKRLTLGSAYNKACRDLQHLGFNTALIMHSFKREHTQINIIDPDDDVVSLK